MRSPPWPRRSWRTAGGRAASTSCSSRRRRACRETRRCCTSAVRRSASPTTWRSGSGAADRYGAAVRALQLTKPSVLEVREIPDPEPGPGEVVVRVGGAGLCHSDLHVLHLPFEVFPLPLTLGHEISGHVETIGPDVTGWSAGDPVLVHLAWGCGTCRQCVAGRDNACATFGRHGTPPAPGLGPPGGMA